MSRWLQILVESRLESRVDRIDTVEEHGRFNNRNARWTMPQRIYHPVILEQ